MRPKFPQPSASYRPGETQRGGELYDRHLAWVLVHHIAHISLEVDLRIFLLLFTLQISELLSKVRVHHCTFFSMKLESQAISVAALVTTASAVDFNVPTLTTKCYTQNLDAATQCTISITVVWPSAFPLRCGCYFYAVNDLT